MATVFLDKLQQVVGLDHVEQARVAVYAGRKCWISSFQVLPQGAQGDLAGWAAAFIDLLNPMVCALIAWVFHFQPELLA